jgi:hypothetical protein
MGAVSQVLFDRGAVFYILNKSCIRDSVRDRVVLLYVQYSEREPYPRCCMTALTGALSQMLYERGAVFYTLNGSRRLILSHRQTGFANFSRALSKTPGCVHYRQRRRRLQVAGSGNVVV